MSVGLTHSRHAAVLAKPFPAMVPCPRCGKKGGRHWSHLGAFAYALDKGSPKPEQYLEVCDGCAAELSDAYNLLYRLVENSGTHRIWARH